MITVVDVVDAINLGRVRFEKYMTEIKINMGKDVGEDLIRAMMLMLPPEAHQAMDEQMPEEHRRAMKLLERR